MAKRKNSTKQESSAGGGEKKNIITLSNVLDDILIRFVLNCPEDESQDEHSAERLFFHLEEAHWFYCDEYTDRYQGKLPALNFEQFAKKILKKDLLADWVKGKTSKELIQQFNKYKYSVPTCGAIIVNRHAQCLAVKGYFSGKFGFPKGKINQNEAKTKCAIREVREEIGFNIADYVDSSVYIERKKSKKNKSPLRLYVVFIPEDATFEPQTRKEISEIAWIPLSMIKSLKVYESLKFCAPRVEELLMEKYGDDIEFHNSVKTMYKHRSKNGKNKKKQNKNRSPQQSRDQVSHLPGTTTLEELEGIFMPLEASSKGKKSFQRSNQQQNYRNHNKRNPKHDRHQNYRVKARPKNIPQRQNSFKGNNSTLKSFSFDRMKIELL